MNWQLLSTEIILGVMSTILTGLGALVTYLINKYIKNDKLKAITQSFNDLVKNSVAQVYQTYVEALKKDSIFDIDAQKEALSKCLNLINKNMPLEMHDWLIKNHSDIDEYIKDTIESHIAFAKRKIT